MITKETRNIATVSFLTSLVSSVLVIYHYHVHLNSAIATVGFIYGLSITLNDIFHPNKNKNK